MFLPDGQTTFLKVGDEIVLHWESDSEATLLFFREGVGRLYVGESNGKISDNWPIAGLPIVAFRQLCAAIAATHGVSVSSEELESGSIEGRKWLKVKLV